MKTIAMLLFGTGVLLAVRVMFFGVRSTVGIDTFRTRAWPLAIGASFCAAGGLLYLQSRGGGSVTTAVIAVVVVLSGLAGVGAWWTVRRSEAAAALSPDPDEDPRYRFQGHVARIVAGIGEPHAGGGVGRIAFVIDGRTLELAAQWLPGTTASSRDGSVNSEVVIERIEDDVALVEPWALVESRL